MSEKLINFKMILSKLEKIGFPIGVFNIITAKINCRPNPHKTVLKFILALFSDMLYAMLSNIIIPSIPVI